MTDIGANLYRGRATERIMASIESHPDQGSAEPYRHVMRACGTGAPMPDDTTPLTKLGAAALIALGILIGACVFMPLGAASKHCDPTVTR